MLDALNILSVILTSTVCLFTMIGWLPYDHWTVRSADFPRLQVIFLGAVCLVMQGYLGLHLEWAAWQYVLTVLLLLCLGYQLWMVLPYTWIWQTQVHDTDTLLSGCDAQGCDGSAASTISVLVANVLMTNRQYSRLLQQIQSYQPDVLLTLETDQKWQTALHTIAADYPYRLYEPRDNFYGMHLYSRYPIVSADVTYLLDDDTPACKVRVRLPDGQLVWLYALHPKPPSPSEAPDATLRDAELLHVAQEIAEHNQPSIVMGDLNDVAWSRTTRLFQRISGLLDPRIGRGFYNTFHAQLPFARWSLDHVFHSRCFGLMSIERLPNIGSDHFPIFAQLAMLPNGLQQAARLTATGRDRQIAANKMYRGHLKSVRLRDAAKQQLVIQKSPV